MSIPNGRPKLLFLCQTLPFPPDGGVEIRSYNTMRLLSERYDVTALCFFRKATRPTVADREKGLSGLSAISAARIFPIEQEHDRRRLLWDHGRSVMTGAVYTRFAYESDEYRQAVRALLDAGSFDLVHLDSLDLSGYLPELGSTPVVCTHHNVESDLLVRRADAETSWVRRKYLLHQASLMRAEEQLWCPQVDLNIAVSIADAERLKEIAPGSRVAVVPNGVDCSAYQPAAGHGQSAVFVGGYSWYPNRDAMEYFAAQILPLIQRECPDFATTWVGRAPATVAEEYEKKHGITLTGYVREIQPFVSTAACFIVPLRVGGGSRLKILDAWAMGKAVVSTSIGCEGLDARDGMNILIRDTPADFAEAVMAVIESSDLRERLGKGARNTAETQYDWTVIGEGMGELYEEVRGRHLTRR